MGNDGKSQAKCSQKMANKAPQVDYHTSLASWAKVKGNGRAYATVVVSLGRGRLDRPTTAYYAGLIILCVSVE